MNDLKNWISQHKELAIAIVLIGAVAVFILISRLKNASSSGAASNTPVSPLQNVPIVGNAYTAGGIDGTQGSILPPTVDGGPGNNGGSGTGGVFITPRPIGPPQPAPAPAAAPQYVTVGQQTSANTLAAIAAAFGKSVQSLIAINGPQSGVTDPNAPLYNGFVVQLY